MDSAGLTAAQFVGTRTAPAVTDFVTGVRPGDFPGETPREKESACIKQTVRDHGLSRGAPFIAIEAHTAVIREFAVPFTRPEQVRKTIKFQAEGHYHSQSIDETLIEYNPLGIGETSTTVWCAALSKDVMKELVETFQQAGISPVAVDLNLAALFTAALFYREKLDDAFPENAKAAPLFMVLDIGEKHCRIVIGDDDNMLDGRSFMISRPEGESLRDKIDKVRETAAKISSEIRKMLLRKNVYGPVYKMYYTGKGASDELVAALAEDLALFREQLDPARVVDVRLEGIDAEEFSRAGVAATGIALKAMGYDPLGFNFRKEEFTYERKFDKLKKGLACTMCLLFVGFFLMAYNFQVKHAHKEMELLQVQKDFQERIYNTMTLGEKAKGNNYLQKLVNVLKKRKGIGRPSGLPKQTSALEYLKDFSTHVYNAKVPIFYDSANFESGSKSARCSVNLRLSSNADGNKIYNEIRKNSKLLDPESPALTATKGEEAKSWKMSMRMIPREVAREE